MARRTTDIIKFVIGIALGVVFLYFTLRDRSFSQMREDLSQANLGWILLSAVFLLLSHWFRALRWRMLLQSAGERVSPLNAYMATLVCYAVNAVTPKFGEVLRCSVLWRTDGVPVAKGFGTVITERAFDVVVLLLGIGVLFLIEIDRIGDLFNTMYGQMGDSIMAIPTIYIMALALGAFLLFLAYIYVRKVRGIRTGLARKAIDFVINLLNAMSSIFLLKRPWYFILLTLLIWASLILMPYFCLLSLEETKGLGFYFAAVIFFVGGLGWMMPTPNGVGTYHYVVLQIFLAFGLSATAGQDLAIINNGSTFIFTVLAGIPAYIAFLVVKRKVKPVE